jgi:hypothetical protein
MRDLPGNALKEGHLVYWRSKGLICKVLKVIEPVIDQSALPTLVLEVGVPLLDWDKRRGGEPEANDFIRLVDPAQEAALNRILQ